MGDGGKLSGESFFSCVSNKPFSCSVLCRQSVDILLRVSLSVFYVSLSITHVSFQVFEMYSTGMELAIGLVVLGPTLNQKFNAKLLQRVFEFRQKRMTMNLLLRIVPPKNLWKCEYKFLQ